MSRCSQTLVPQCDLSRHNPNLGTSYRAFPKPLPTMGFDSVHINLSSYSHLALAGDVGNLHANKKTVRKHEITQSETHTNLISHTASGSRVSSY